MCLAVKGAGFYKTLSILCADVLNWEFRGIQAFTFSSQKTPHLVSGLQTLELCLVNLRLVGGGFD